MSGEFDHLLEPAGEFDNLLPSETVEQKQPDNLVTRIQKFGYSGLSDDDKKVFDEQYKTSVKANQAKMSLPLQMLIRMHQISIFKMLIT
jgi:hypothetical protein